jgi:hypothetical protein
MSWCVLVLGVPGGIYTPGQEHPRNTRKVILVKVIDSTKEGNDMQQYQEKSAPIVLTRNDLRPTWIEEATRILSEDWDGTFRETRR